MMPTEQKEVAGHMMPTFLGSVAKFGSITKVGFKGKRRRITIETYTPLGAEESAKVKPRGSSVMNARSFHKLMAGRSSRAGFQTDQLGEEDMIIFRMFKAKPTTSAFKDNQSYAESLGMFDSFYQRLAISLICSLTLRFFRKTTIHLTIFHWMYLFMTKMETSDGRKSIEYGFSMSIL